MAAKEERITKQFIVDHLEEGEADLSLCYLTSVPVKELIAVGRFKKLDLSQNKLTTLPDSFVNLQFVTVLDLSKNQLTHLPDNFGELTQLQRLDLFGNALSTLPVSFSDLSKLRWLDVRANQLEPGLVKVAGDCCNEKECKECAFNIVKYMQQKKEEQEKIDKVKADKKKVRDRKKEKKRQINQAEAKKQKEEDKVRKRRVWNEKQQQVQLEQEELQRTMANGSNITGEMKNSTAADDGSFELKLIRFLIILLIILIGLFALILILYWEEIHPQILILYDIAQGYLLQS